MLLCTAARGGFRRRVEGAHKGPGGGVIKVRCSKQTDWRPENYVRRFTESTEGGGVEVGVSWQRAK